MSPAAEAVERVGQRALRRRHEALNRLNQAIGPELMGAPSERWAALASGIGRLTLNFHPDRIATSGVTVAAGLLSEGRYRSQWATGISNGGRSAIAGGERQRWEHKLFEGV